MEEYCTVIVKDMLRDFKIADSGTINFLWTRYTDTKGTTILYKKFTKKNASHASCCCTTGGHDHDEIQPVMLIFIVFVNARKSYMVNPIHQVVRAFANTETKCNAQ